jgi:pimeloyl-ACP methyl ester carboxylesterase
MSTLDSSRGPTSRFFFSQRLRLHYLDWGNEGAPPVLLVHGGRDHAQSWAWVAEDLRRDHHLIAPDLRGHGDSAWAMGGMYAIADFVLDVTQLLDAVQLFPITIIGHSLGGAVSLMYTALFPERVARVVAIEGLGPSPEMLTRMRDVTPWQRMQNWIEEMKKLAGRQPRRYPDLDAAAARMREENPFLSEEQARHLTVHGALRNEDGTYSWKFDNYVRAFSPYRWDPEEMRTLWRRVTCPTLLLRGTKSWASDPAQDGRLSVFSNARFENVEGAGHWVHHDRLPEFLRVVRGFLAEAQAPERAAGG